MTRYAIDGATLLALVRSGRSLADGHRLVAPNALRTHALDLLWREVRAGTVDARDAERLHDPITEVKVRLLGDRVSRSTAWALAREHDWPDLRHAEYLAVARLQADALVAGDPDLARAADGIVPLVSLDALFT